MPQLMTMKVPSPALLDWIAQTTERGAAIDRLMEPFAADARAALAAFDREVEALSEDEQFIEMVEPLGDLCALIERITRAACTLRGAVFNEPCEEEALDEEVEVAA